MTKTALRAKRVNTKSSLLRGRPLTLPNGGPVTSRKAKAAATGQLYYGDNLEILRSETGNESIDVIYLDPPFNSNKVYNVVFDGAGDTQAQLSAFEDAWRWTNQTEEDYEALMSGGLPARAATALGAMYELLQKSNMMAYVVHMLPRIVQLHRVLKPTGSLFLHCDPTAGHYLKVILDSVFGPENFRNEIVWRRTGAHGETKSFAPLHDNILFYTKTDDYYFRPLKKPYTKRHVTSRYTEQKDGRWKFTTGGNILTGAGAGGGESSKPWRGFDPVKKNRHWAVPGYVTRQLPPHVQKLGVLDRLEAAYEAGLIEILSGSAWPTPVKYLEPTDGTPMGDIWAYQPGTEGVLATSSGCIDEDVAYLGPTSPERLGYPTQKPMGLLKRILEASCPEDGLVLDPFCGCGTTLDAAISLKRSWIGIDVTYVAVDIIVHRLRKTFGDEVDKSYEILGLPEDMKSAQALFTRSPFDFERWAVSRIGGTPNHRQVGDAGKDGLIHFRDVGGTLKKILISVKGGKSLAPTMVRDLAGVVASDPTAAMGILITLCPPTPGMIQAANTAGNFKHADSRYPKVQIISIEQLFAGVMPSLPPVLAPYSNLKKPHQLTLALNGE